MALSSTFLTATLWLFGHFIQCLAVIILLTVIHLMSSFEVNYFSSFAFGFLREKPFHMGRSDVLIEKILLYVSFSGLCS